MRQPSAPGPAAVDQAVAPVRDVSRPAGGASAAELVELGELRASVRQLERRAGEAESALIQAQAEVAKYQTGLQRCVDELNRSATAAAARPAYAPSMAPSRQAAARVSTLGSPDVQIAGDTIYVTGRLWNAGDADARGRIDIELLRDGSVLAVKTLSLDMAARTDFSYSADFRVGAGTGTYSARVRLDY